MNKSLTETLKSTIISDSPYLIALAIILISPFNQFFIPGLIINAFVFAGIFTMLCILQFAN